jgi:C-terminal processing protease CtpA/Prc
LATNYLNEVIGVMQSNSVNRLRIDWASFRTQVFQHAQGASSIPDTYPVISFALGLLGDHHSAFITPTNTLVANPNAKQCSAAFFSARPSFSDIGYVMVTAFSATDAAASTAFADSIQQQILFGDSSAVVGWIVDLRGNGGGNMWPMLAGVGPVLNDGLAGYFVPPTGAATPWSYQNGASVLGTAAITKVTTPYQLVHPAPRVAVLTNGLVASSGEAIVVAFRARPNTRSFGTATCGLSTANAGFKLSDGATLNLTDAVDADRAQTQYGDAIVPDEVITGDAEVVARAVAWLRSG